MKTITSFFLLFLLPAIFSKHVQKETSNHPVRYDFTLGERANPDLLHQVVFSIQQKNIDELERILYDVSTISSPNYGNHLSFEEVGTLVENRVATDAVLSWLQENSVDIKSTSAYGEYIVCNAPVRKWEEMFQTNFYEYHDNVDVSETTMTESKIIRSEALNLPEELASHIATVFNTADLPPRFAKPHPPKASTQEDIMTGINLETSFYGGFVVPSKLQDLYGVTGDSAGYGSMAVMESLDDTFLPSDLKLFQRNFNLPIDKVDAYHGTYPDGSICNTNVNRCGESSLDLQYILAVAPKTPITYWYESDYSNSLFLTFILSVSAAKNPPKVFSISYGGYEGFVQPSSLTSFNTEAKKLGVRGVSIIVSSGDDGVAGYAFRSAPMSKCGYFAQWPASSPYVTAVGGTQGGIPLNGKAEVACSSDTDGVITSGGGFSESFARPAFQKNAIDSFASKYTALHPNVGETHLTYLEVLQDFTYANRGYPDVSAAAGGYYVVVGGKFYLFYGTSASSPVFAGMIALINSQRLQQGKATLGWLNPSIYSNNGQFTNDITEGNNRCVAGTDASGKASCCPYGFNATEGWDPVTGFGSVDYPKLLSYYLNVPSTTAKPSRRPTRTPKNFRAEVLPVDMIANEAADVKQASSTVEVDSAIFNQLHRVLRSFLSLFNTK